ncbi:MAG: DUF488 domain-containing protein [Acidobacteria bacterium]|nr:DUF488 domain-containing protein [Acidobacteriota bacterium]
MKITICTIGFAGKTAEEFFRLLREAGVQEVIDIRENRAGQLAGFAKYPDIAFFLKQLGSMEYRHEPPLAPSTEIRKSYRRGRDWAAYEPTFLALMREREIPERVDLNGFKSTVALLCSEPGPEKCHRRLVADLLANYWQSLGHSVEVKHLVSENSVPPKKKRKRSSGDDGADPQ